MYWVWYTLSKCTIFFYIVLFLTLWNQRHWEPKCTWQGVFELNFRFFCLIWFNLSQAEKSVDICAFNAFCRSNDDKLSSTWTINAINVEKKHWSKQGCLRGAFEYIWIANILLDILAQVNDCRVEDSIEIYAILYFWCKISRTPCARLVLWCINHFI